MYCIECEMNLTPSSEKMVNDVGFHFTLFNKKKDEWEICYGEFTFSAPPEIEDDWYGTGWQDNLEEPDPEELEMMDRAAESLELEFANA